MKDNFSFFKYLEEYNDSIHEFVFNQAEIHHNNDFLNDFYRTYKSMLLNNVDLSDKQIKIIEKEMVKNQIYIPKLEDFEFKITIFVGTKLKTKENKEILINNIDLGNFFKLLEISSEFEQFIKSKIGED